MGLSAQEEHTFDLSEIEKKAFQFGGYLEFRPVLFGSDKNSWLYKLKFYDLEEGETIAEYNFNALLDASYEKGIIKAKIRTNTDITKSFSGWSHNTTLFEAFLSVKPSLSFHFDIGKKRMRWGKGYAWNPVAFIDRPKNPNDPELALEGERRHHREKSFIQSRIMGPARKRLGYFCIRTYFCFENPFFITSIQKGVEIVIYNRFSFFIVIKLELIKPRVSIQAEKNWAEFKISTELKLFFFYF